MRAAGPVLARSESSLRARRDDADHADGLDAHGVDAIGPVARS